MFKTLTALIALALPILAGAEDLPSIKLGALEYGTVNWELDTIKNNKLDEANGFTLEVVPMGGGDASDIAFLGGEIDAMVSDWLWVAAQRAEGRDMKFIPYSTAVGSMMVKPDSGIESLADLEGKTVGIAGGPLDKNWLIFQAYGAKEGMDIAAISNQEFGAPPLMFKSALSGEIDAVINFWHFQAKAKAAGLVEIISVDEAASALGLNANTPLLGYVINGDMDVELAQSLAKASRAAKDILATDDAAWDALRERMKPANDAEFEALKEGFRAGIPDAGPVDQAAVAQMLALMGELGGEELVGKATTLPDDLFVDISE